MTVGPETCYRVRGGVPLRGTVFVQGAKNAALKMIAASLLASEGRTFRSTVRPSDASSEAAIILSAAFLAPCTNTVPRSGTPPRTR